MYSQNADVYPSHHNPQVAHRARRSAMPSGKYGNMYAAPQNIPNPNRSRNILVAIIAVVVIVVVLVVAMMLSHQTAPQTNIPVTGAQSTQNAESESSSDQQQTDSSPDQTAPTEFTLKYSVDKAVSLISKFMLTTRFKSRVQCLGQRKKPTLARLKFALFLLKQRAYR